MKKFPRNSFERDSYSWRSSVQRCDEKSAAWENEKMQDETSERRKGFEDLGEVLGCTSLSCSLWTKSVTHLLVWCFFSIHFSLSMLSCFFPPVLPKIICLLRVFVINELYFCPQSSMSAGPWNLFHALFFILIMQLGLGDDMFIFPLMISGCCFNTWLLNILVTTSSY